MIDDPLTGLALIAATATTAQWVGARTGIPSVLFLLVAGVGVGPLIDPDALYGELLFSAVALGVAVLLFEGGTSLRWADLTIGRAPVLRLVSVGAAIAWAVGAFAAHLALDVDGGIAVLIGAVLIVSGPTVVMPLLRVVRAREPVDSILRWEGIVIDPIGAGLAVVVLDAILEDRSPARIAIRVATTFGAGLVVGTVIAVAIIWALGRRLIADHLEIPATLAALIAAYAVANEIRPEAGLVSATLLGIAFANQKRVPASHIAEFNEHLGTAILGMLFVVLGARVELDAVTDNLAASALIAASLILVARPLSVMASTLGTGTTWRTRGFLMTLAPRGVVAAAVASLFALELEHHDVDPGPLVPVVFTVVVITVTVAGLGAAYAARRLRIAQPPPNGVALIGGGPFAVEFADALGRLQVPTIHVGLEDDHQPVAERRGQLIYSGRLDSDDFHRSISSIGVSVGVALSGIDHLDRYATERLASIIDTANLYGLVQDDFDGEREAATSHAIEPELFLPAHMTPTELARFMDDGGQVRVVQGSRHPRSGWLTVCRVDQNGIVAFTQDPTTAGPTDWLVQLGPGLTTEES